MAMQAKVKRPKAISSRVLVPITRLAKVVAYCVVSPGTPAEYMPRPNTTAHCQGPIPPLEGTPIERLDSTQHTNTAVASRHAVHINHLGRERQRIEGHIKLNEIAAPQQHGKQQPAPFARHGGYDGEALPDAAAEIRQLLYETCAAEGMQQQRHHHHGPRDPRPEPGRGHQVGEAMVGVAVLPQIIQHGVAGKHESDQRQQSHHYGVAQAVGDHRAKHTVKGHILPPGYISRTPELAEARQHEIHRITAEYTEHQREKRHLDAEGAKLYAPSHGADHMAEDGQTQAEQYPAEVTLSAYHRHHIPHVLPLEKQIAEANADHQRHAELNQRAPHLAATALARRPWILDSAIHLLTESVTECAELIIFILNVGTHGPCVLTA